MSGGTLIPDFYNSKINVALFYAPIASLKETTSPFFKKVAEYGLPEVIEFFELLHFYDVAAYHWWESWTLSLGCKLFDGELCSLLLESFADKQPKYDNAERYPVFFSFIPSGAGYKNLAHYA